MEPARHAVVTELAGTLLLAALLERVRERWGRYELVNHWQQGEFHHDLVVRVPDVKGELPGGTLVVATNCNGGVKEVLYFATAPDRLALWHWRCPDNPEFSGELPAVLARATTTHWFDPCELLGPDARSEYREEFRERQSGGGWRCRVSESAC
ncbi:MAG TPA: hypothetical protein VMI54_08240 [Polyangiaceae bacterium]|nr:hypothetical protein [Polyangiaceae bacterium]